MKKYRLEEIRENSKSKNNSVFTEPPVGYFDKLPGIIQAKTAHKAPNGPRVYWMGALKLVPAVAAVVLILFYTGVLGPKTEVSSIESQLAEVSTEDLIEYLASVDLTTEELLDEVDFTDLSLDFEEVDQNELLENLDLDDASLIELYGDLQEDEVI